MKGSGAAAAGLVVVGLLISGCSSSSSSREAPSGRGAAAVSAEALLISEGGLVRYDVATGLSEPIEAGIRFGGYALRSPDGSEIALTIRRGSSTYLGLLSSDGSFREVHWLPNEASYSVAWAPSSDSLFFGYATPEDRGVGVYALNPGDLVDVGCRASSTALSWGSEDWFVVGDGTNHYVVERAGCGTIESIDARKMHEVRFDPTGQSVAYVLRELAYNREANQYQPDSSLYVASSTGSDPILVAGDRYRPHRPSWAPDGAALAFDARLLEDVSRRLISIYDMGDARSAYLNPSAVDGDISEWDAHWSPSGTAIAYSQSSGDRAAAVAVRVLASSFTSVVSKPGESFVAWLDDEHMVVSGNGSTRVVQHDGAELLVTDASATVLSLDAGANAGSR